MNKSSFKLVSPAHPIATLSLCLSIIAGTIAHASPVYAQSLRACPHQESDRELITRTLQSAATCQRANDLLNACRSNTSGDVELAEIVIARCEGDFLKGLSTGQHRTYQKQREACRKRYERKQGTMYVSFIATCEAGVAASFARRR